MRRYRLAVNWHTDTIRDCTPVCLDIDALVNEVLVISATLASHFPSDKCGILRYAALGSAFILRSKKSTMASPISPAWVSKAKCPVSKKWISAPGMSRRYASAPGGRKNGHLLFPHTANKGGRRVRKYSGTSDRARRCLRSRETDPVDFVVAGPPE